LRAKRTFDTASFCGLQKQFSTKATKGSQKQEMKILSSISSPISRKQKLSFYFLENFCMPFVLLGHPDLRDCGVFF